MVFCEHTLLIRYVLKCAEYHEPFYKALIAIALVFGTYVLLFIPDGYLVHILSCKEKPKIYKAMREKIYEKAAKIDLACYDNSEYYNDFVISVAESDKTVDRFFEFLRIMLSGLMIFLTTGIFYLALDSVGLVFLAMAFSLSILVAKKANQLNYAVRMKINPLEKEKKYVRRLFYLNDYAKEMRLYPKNAARLEEEFFEANKKIMDEEKKAGTKRMWLSFSRQYCLSSFITDGIYIAYLIYKVIVLRTIDYSDAIVLFHRTGEMRRGISNFSDVLPKINENNMYIEKIRLFLEYEPQIVNNEEGKQPVINGDIAIEHMSFRYTETAEDTLHDISLKVKAGEHIAIVGYNGAGKTTLVKLLMRLYEPTQGKIMYDNTNISEFNLRDYRNLIGVIFQDYQIYGATLGENVVLDTLCDSNEHQESKIVESLTNSGFGNRLNQLEKGINTVLTTEFDTKGVNLSGGESQKVATSRCFYRDANILIMDEPSSALDPIAEYSLNKAMSEMAKNKTVFYVSHRLSTTKHADRIIMMEKGRIIEEGTHEQLLKMNGKYAEMWKVQAGRYTAVM